MILTTNTPSGTRCNLNTFPVDFLIRLAPVDSVLSEVVYGKIHPSPTSIERSVPLASIVVFVFGSITFMVFMFFQLIPRVLTGTSIPIPSVHIDIARLDILHSFAHPSQGFKRGRLARLHLQTSRLFPGSVSCFTQLHLDQTPSIAQGGGERSDTP